MLDLDRSPRSIFPRASTRNSSWKATSQAERWWGGNIGNTSEEVGRNSAIPYHCSGASTNTPIF
jgi:hypothetical protein